jgi:hypothetical protein
MALKKAFSHHFAPTDHLWLFGSRVDANARGGDIDLYIETTIIPSQEVLDNKLSFLCELYEAIGLQKIDVVLNLVGSNTHLPIYDIAKSEGVQLL